MTPTLYFIAGMATMLTIILIGVVIGGLIAGNEEEYDDDF
jgi:hypothetical protein